MQVKMAATGSTFTPASSPRKRANTNGSAAKPDLDLEVEEWVLPMASTLTFVSSGMLPTELPDACAAGQWAVLGEFVQPVDGSSSSPSCPSKVHSNEVAVCGMWYVVFGRWYVLCGMWYVVCSQLNPRSTPATRCSAVPNFRTIESENPQTKQDWSDVI